MFGVRRRIRPAKRLRDSGIRLEYSAVAIRNYHDAGFTASLRSTLATLAACLDRLGCHEPAATIVGFAFDPLTAAWLPEVNTTVAHLRDVLGDQTYQSLARKGQTMTTAAMATYAYDQIDQARAELEEPADSMGNTKDRG